MKILFSAPNIYVDGNTGDATHVRELAHNLSKYNNEVDVLARKKKSIENSSDFKFKKVWINLPLDSLITLPFFVLSTFINTLYLIAKNNYTCIYERHYIFDTATIIGKLLSIRTILEVNGLLIEESKDQEKYGSLSYLFAQKWEKYIFSNVDRIVVGVDELKNILVNEYSISPEKIEIVPNGANIDVFRPIKNAKEKVQLKENDKYVCFVGNIVGWQGLEYLIESVPLVISKIKNVAFIIVGTGPEENKILDAIEKSGYKNHFLYTGAVPYELVPLYINASDVCITLKKELKSGYSPTKLYEYMACEKPVVASNFSGHQILQQYNAGILVNPKSVSETSNAIIKLLNNDSLCKYMGENGRKAVVENFSWNRVARDIYTILNGMSKR